MNFFIHELWTGVTFIPITLLLAFVPMLTGLIFGSLFAIFKIQKVRILNELTHFYILIFRSMPIVLTLLIMYFVIIYGVDWISGLLNLQITSGDIPPLALALIILSLISIAFTAESIRAALQSVSQGQIEAAYSVGMKTRTVYRRIIFPQALPVAIPILGSTFIGLLQGTALVYMLGVTDLITGVKIEANANYRYLEAYIAIAIIYWLLTIIIEQGIRLLSKRVHSFTEG
ncbi:ABC-type amino acid transport system permease subunit [Fontibacillus solani]|uniref:ABC-type amino acid transport system permease subunit n=1 Tax=Fontibacillus solani TaxID=1572857 RepID=A0A7W3XU39_9BACL|nr:amino acid ABC transporter permease [Fontibacillus solani]MBA9088442.1 ABC-type amino acid transport system permease subunit [Fontibacillus solani]